MPTTGLFLSESARRAPTSRVFKKAVPTAPSSPRPLYSASSPNSLLPLLQAYLTANSPKMLSSVRASAGRVSSATPSRSVLGPASSKVPSCASRIGLRSKNLLQSAGFATRASGSSKQHVKSIFDSSGSSALSSSHIRSGSLNNSTSTAESQRARLMNVNLGAKENIYEAGHSRRSCTSLSSIWSTSHSSLPLSISVTDHFPSL